MEVRGLFFFGFSVSEETISPRWSLEKVIDFPSSMLHEIDLRQRYFVHR